MAHEILKLEEISSSTGRKNYTGIKTAPPEVDPAIFSTVVLPHVPLYLLQSRPGPTPQYQYVADKAQEGTVYRARLVPLSIPSHARRILSIKSQNNERTYYSNTRHILQFTDGEVMSGLIMLLDDKMEIEAANVDTEIESLSCANKDYCDTSVAKLSHNAKESATSSLEELLGGSYGMTGENNACVVSLKAQANGAIQNNDIASASAGNDVATPLLQSLFVIEWDWAKCVDTDSAKSGLHNKLKRRYFGKKNTTITMVAVVAPDRTVMWIPLFEIGENLIKQIEYIRQDNNLTAYWPTYLDGPNIWICKLENLPWLPFGRRSSKKIWDFLKDFLDRNKPELPDTDQPAINPAQ